MKEDQLDQVFDYVVANGLTSSLQWDLRKEWPELHFTHCSDDEVTGPKPIREGKDFNLYLVAKSDHCVGFTPDLEHASGVVVAEIEDEEE